MALRLLPIARPCHERFDAMTGDARKRFCAACDKHVHDLSAGSEEEARALLARNEGVRICVRFARNENGTVRFRAAAFAAATAAAVAAGAMSMTACASHASDAKVEDPSSVEHDMGDMIPDQVDRCPDDPSSKEDDDGCPAGDAGAD